MSEKTYKKYFFAACVGIALFFVYRIVQPFLPAVVWAGILATASYPVYRKISKYLHRPRLSSALTCVLLTVVIVLPILLLMVLLADQSVDAYRVIEEKVRSEELSQWETIQSQPSYEWMKSRLGRLGIEEPDLGQVAIRAAQEISGFLVSRSTEVFSRFARFIFNFFVMIVALYYFFVDGPTLVLRLRELTPLASEHEDKVLGKFKDVVGATLRGSFLTALLQGIAGGIVFLCFGLPSPLLWGSVMALFSLVPLVGTALVWMPVVIYFIIAGYWLKAFFLAIICVGIVGSIDNVAKPFLIRGKVEIHTLWVFFGVLGGVGVFGFLGLVLGPLFVALLFTLLEIYRIDFREELAIESPP